MSSQRSIQSDFTQTYAIHIALKNALKSKKYDGLPAVQKAAEALCKELGSDQSVYNRQLKMISMLQKGASMMDLHRKLKCSRRTLYRYLNEFEEAGVSIQLEGKKYHIDQTIAQMLRM